MPPSTITGPVSNPYKTTNAPDCSGAFSMNLFWETQGEITPPNFAQHTIQMGFRVFLKILWSLLLNALQERFTTAFASPRWGIKKSKRGGACGENSLALRPENVSLREPLSDLRAANANPCAPERCAWQLTRVHPKAREDADGILSYFLVDPTRDHSVSRKKVYG